MFGLSQSTIRRMESECTIRRMGESGAVTRSLVRLPVETLCRTVMAPEPSVRGFLLFDVKSSHCADAMISKFLHFSAHRRITVKRPVAPRQSISRFDWKHRVNIVAIFLGILPVFCCGRG